MSIMPDLEDPTNQEETVIVDDHELSAGPDADDTKTAADALTAVKLYFKDFPEVPPVNDVIRRATLEYLAVLDHGHIPSPDIVERTLLAVVNGVIKSVQHKAEDKAERLAVRKALSNWQVAQVMLSAHNLVRIAPAGHSSDREYDILAIYQDAPDAFDYGTYLPSEHEIRQVARRYNTSMTIRDAKEVETILREESPRVHKTQDPDLVPVQNGILYYGTTDRDITINGKTFHFTAKQVHDFDPAMVFTSKAVTRYVPDAPVRVITHPEREDWEVTEWIESLSDDEGVPDLLWEIIGAVVRPNVRWNKTAWFFSEQGNNGKGTLCELVRNVIGSGAHTSLPLAQFGDDFALEPLMKVQAIITDENDVGTYIDKAANLKAIVTNDVIRINRKYRASVAYQFRGFMIQCLNEFPATKDKSDSFYRRQLFVPFKKWFGGGAEKPYIKEDYLQRPEVLEYVLWYVINQAGADSPGEHYRLSEPPVTQDVLEEYKETNDPVRFFWEEFRLCFVWDLLPFNFAYDLYKSWFARVSPSGKAIGYKSFVPDLVAIVRHDSMWECEDKQTKHRPKDLMNVGEPLVAEYDLEDWKCPTYTGSNPVKIGQPKLKAHYRGLLRVLGAQNAQEPDASSEELAA